MTKILLTALCISLLLPLASCREEGRRFHVTGQIEGAEDTVLYLEHLTLDQGPAAIDSVKLGPDGEFHLSAPAPLNPEFYRLRVGGQSITLAIDSTESVRITAALATMATDYAVEGSGECDTIRLLRQEMRDLTRRVNAIADDRTLTIAERQAAIDKAIAEHKTRVKLVYVQNRYHCASSYYAMFQTVGNAMLFDPVTDASDVTWVSAVANAWAERWPGQPRTQNLMNIALRGHRNTRRKVLEINMDDDKVSETGIIDMTFPDVNGQELRLGSLRGQVVVLDFTAYNLRGSQDRTIALRALYDKYAPQGLEIYQVSLDADEHYWQTMARPLPWKCVWCRDGLDNDIVRIYNLQQLPTWFIIDRNGDLCGRQELMGPLEEEIKKLL